MASSMFDFWLTSSPGKVMVTWGLAGSGPAQQPRARRAVARGASSASPMARVRWSRVRSGRVGLCAADAAALGLCAAWRCRLLLIARAGVSHAQLCRLLTPWWRNGTGRRRGTSAVSKPCLLNLEPACFLPLPTGSVRMREGGAGPGLHLGQRLGEMSQGRGPQTCRSHQLRVRRCSTLVQLQRRGQPCPAPRKGRCHQCP